MRIDVVTTPIAEGEEWVKEPFIRAVLDGSGCDLPHCRCSPPNFLAISDGKVVLTVDLTAAQAKQLRKSGVLCTA